MTKTADETGSRAKPWHARLWHGMTVGPWFSMLARNRFAVSPSRVVMAVLISLTAVANSLFALVQRILLGRKIARTRIDQSPIFVLGHWRSGTTLLHELLTLDDRHTYADTYACMAPNHFLVSRCLCAWWAWLLLPKHRPMDNFPVGLKRPQEDEWALCAMGVPTPYEAFAFPNRLPQHPEYADLRDLPAGELTRWKQAMVAFLKCVSYLSPKRIVLKSPLHTCRVETLAELFPDARFVHIVRHPFAVYPSTIRLWKRLSADHGLQTPKLEGLEESVLATFSRMYDAFESSRPKLKPGRFCEVHYEELVADPVGQMRRIYQALEMDDFDKVLPALESYAAETSDFKTNRYQLSLSERNEIARRWRGFFERYGYSPTDALSVDDETPPARQSPSAA